MAHDSGRPHDSRHPRRTRLAVLAAAVAVLASSALAATAVDASPRPAAASRVTWTKGHPWTGLSGKSETVAHMMARAGRTPPSLREYGQLPEGSGPNKKPNPAAPAVSSWPPGAGDSTGPVSGRSILPRRTPQTLGTNFLGATLAESAFPPDTMGAAGPTQFVVDVNDQIRSFDKATGLADGVLNVDTDAFWASVMTPIGGSITCNFTSDPRIRYDRLSGRWFFVMIDVPNCTGHVANRIMIAATNTSTITGATVITKFQFDNSAVTPAAAGRFADYPTLGIDNQALYIGDNVFPTAGGGQLTSDGFVVNKASVLSGGPITVTAFRDLVNQATFVGPVTPQGVDNYDPASNEGYFIGVDGASFSLLQIRRVANPGGSPSISSNLPLTVPTTFFPETVPHLGNAGSTNGRLDALDDRLFAAHIRNGRLWTAHNIEVNSSGVASSVGSRDAVRWYELTGIRSADGAPLVVQSGTIFDNSAVNPKYYWIPSVMVSGQGHAAFGFSQAGNANNVDAATVGRLAGDTLGTTQTIAPYTASSFAYNPPSDPGGPFGRRWGDYSYTSLDPLDDMTMWTIQQFTNATNSYGVQIVKLIAPPPATPASASGSVPAGAASTSVTITGTQVSGSGFYDPGANLGGTAVNFNHIQGSVSGGVTVNSATYNSPTSVTLDLNTTGASPGNKDVTITNPDGQALTGVGILTVTGGATADLVVTKFHAVSRVEIGKPFSYTLSVKNNGPSTATNVDLSDTLPTSMTYASHSTTGGLTCGTTPAVGSTGLVDCTAASLTSGATATVTLKVRPTRTGTFGNTATVTSSTTEGSPGDESDTDMVTVETNAKGCTIVGTSGNDTITGTGSADVICGMAGTDHLDGAAGPDTLYGQADADTLVDHSGLDTLLGGGGGDNLDTADAQAGDLVDGQKGTDTCTADGTDTVKHCP